MKLNTVIFDMDGLLIDSEPLWKDAGDAMLSRHAVAITDEQYHLTMGLRTPEWTDHWFTHFDIDKQKAGEAIVFIEDYAIEMIRKEGKALPGADYIMSFFKDRNFKIGLASSSPMRLINVVVDKLGIRSYLSAIMSAESLAFGKPHPQVFMDCAAQMLSSPLGCICFEDSFNGMIAAKAARMKCVVVPAPQQHDETRWDAADFKLPSLFHFNQQILEKL